MEKYNYEPLNQTSAVSNILSLRVSSSRLRRCMNHQNNESIKRESSLNVRQNGFKSWEIHFVTSFLQTTLWSDWKQKKVVCFVWEVFTAGQMGGVELISGGQLQAIK